MRYRIIHRIFNRQCPTGGVGGYYRQIDQLPQHTMTPPTKKYEPRLHIVLHQPEIPYNTGSVGRTCVAVAAKLWLVRPLGFRVDDYYLHSTGLDYWEHLEWQVVDNWDDLQQALPAARPSLAVRKKGYPIVSRCRLPARRCNCVRQRILRPASRSPGKPSRRLALTNTDAARGPKPQPVQCRRRGQLRSTEAIREGATALASHGMNRCRWDEKRSRRLPKDLNPIPPRAYSRLTLRRPAVNIGDRF